MLKEYKNYLFVLKSHDAYDIMPHDENNFVDRIRKGVVFEESR